jgi:hypothetical protein
MSGAAVLHRDNDADQQGQALGDTPRPFAAHGEWLHAYQ